MAQALRYLSGNIVDALTSEGVDIRLVDMMTCINPAFAGKSKNKSTVESNASRHWNHGFYEILAQIDETLGMTPDSEDEAKLAGFIFERTGEGEVGAAFKNNWDCLMFLGEDTYLESFKAVLAAEHLVGSEEGFAAFKESIQSLFQQLVEFEETDLDYFSGTDDESFYECSIVRCVFTCFVLTCLKGARDYRDSLEHIWGAPRLVKVTAVMNGPENVVDFRTCKGGTFRLDAKRRIALRRDETSRAHCVVDFESGHWLLHDCSSNGTYVRRYDRGCWKVVYQGADLQGEGFPLEDGDLISLAEVMTGYPHFLFERAS